MRRAIQGTIATAALVLTSVSPAAPPQRWWVKAFPPPSIQMAEERLPRFERRNVLPNLSCGSVDTARPAPEGGVLLNGWAIDPRKFVPAKAVVVFDNDRRFPRPVHVYRDRPDIAKLGNNRAMMPTGWLLWIPADEIGPGHHVFTVYAVLEDGKLGLVGTKEVDLPHVDAPAPR